MVISPSVNYVFNLRIFKFSQIKYVQIKYYQIKYVLKLNTPKVFQAFIFTVHPSTDCGQLPLHRMRTIASPPIAADRPSCSCSRRRCDGQHLNRRGVQWAVPRLVAV